MKCIFLVEDNQDNADLIRDILEDRFHLLHFNQPEILLRGLREKTLPMAELFLLDISLPGMDGVDLLRAIRQLSGYGDIPAIALTAHALAHDRGRFLSAGFNDYVSKPIVDEDLLLDAISNALSE